MPKPIDITKPLTLPRAYANRIAPELNAGKRDALEAMHLEWSRTLPHAFDWYWSDFLQGGRFRADLSVSGPKSVFPKTKLVTSQKDLMLRAVVGQATSWTSNLKNRLRNAVMNSRVEDDLRHQLLWINSMKAWLLPYGEQVILLNSQPKKRVPLPSWLPLRRGLCARSCAIISQGSTFRIRPSCRCRSM